MSLGRLFFAFAILLGLAYFALRSPVPVADPRFIKEDFPGPGASLSISVFLDTGYPRERAHKTLADSVTRLREREQGFGADPVARAKAVDAVMADLAAAGITSAMVNFGGSLRTRGQRGTAPWRIGIRNPGGRPPKDALAYLLTTQDEAVTTRLSEDGAPAGPFRSVTVVGSDGPAVASAAQALFASTPEQWRARARELGAEQALAVTASGEILVTAALNARLKFLWDLQARVLP